MADNTTELEVLDEIVDVLGGQSGQYETVVPTLQQIRDLLGGGGGGGGYNPALSVGRADALTGADSTAQWAQRESTGSGAATVRSVQGAAVGWNQSVNAETTSQTGFGITLVPSQDTSWAVSGTVSDSPAMPYIDVDTWTEAKRNAAFTPNHKYLIKVYDTVCTPTNRFAYVVLTGVGIGYTEISASSQRIVTPTDVPSGVYIRVNTNGYGGATVSGTVAWNIFDLTQMFGAGNEPTTVAEFEQMFPEAYYPYSAPTLKPVQIAGIASTDAQGGELDSVEWPTQTLRAADSVRDELTADALVTRVGERAYQSGDESDATVRTDGTTTYYPLATPTTTPISPALPMTYRVEQGGSESIIVPDGEVSAAPVLTVADGESAADVVMDALACIATPDGPVATANHAVGTYLTMQGKLYKVTSAIAVGETIKSGTNVSQTTVMAELIARTA